MTGPRSAVIVIGWTHGPLRHLPALPRLAWSTSSALTLASLSLRIARAGVPAGMLCVVKLVVEAVVAGGPIAIQAFR